MSKRLATILVVALAACSDSAMEPQLNLRLQPCAEGAPLYGEPDAKVPDRIIVVFHEGTNALEAAEELAERLGFELYRAWDGFGFAAHLSADALAGVRCDSRVAFVEYDREAQLAI